MLGNSARPIGQALTSARLGRADEQKFFALLCSHSFFPIIIVFYTGVDMKTPLKVYHNVKVMLISNLTILTNIFPLLNSQLILC